MAELQSKEIKERCYKCKLPSEYGEGKITLEQARTKCANCHFGSLRLYKFDIIMQLFNSNTEQKKIEPVQEKTSSCQSVTGLNRGGKRETYTKRYGVAITKLQNEGKTIRQIADILGISPTSVTKVIKLLKPDNK